MIEWIKCPDCGKNLCKADTSKENTLYLWCKGCKKEVEIKIGAHTTCIVTDFNDLPEDVQKQIKSDITHDKLIDFSGLHFNKKIGEPK